MSETNVSARAGRDYLMLIGGERVAARSGATTRVLNPTTGLAIAEVPEASSVDVDRAVAAAYRAFASWRRTNARHRADLLMTIAARVRERVEELAYLDALDCGNPINAMREDVLRSASSIEYYAGLALEVKGATVPATAENLHYTRREPYGVVARILAFNHPFLFAAGSLGPILATGNTLVLKPAPQTPLSALVLGEIVSEVLPDGVVNIVTGGAEAGSALVRHERVRRIQFTGSLPTGRAILREAAASDVLKQVTLELGGKNPLIVFPDADLDAVARGVIDGMNLTKCQGQSCGSTSRVFAHRDVRSELVEQVHRLVAEIAVGDPLEETTDMGPLVSVEHHARVMGFVESGLGSGARLVYGGRRPDDESLRAGNFVLPTLFDEVDPSSRLATEEIFGPVISTIPWDDEEEMFEAVNASQYGLTASIWTNDLKKAIGAAHRVEAGTVTVNGVSRWKGMPFGGYKNSGLGRQNDIDEMYSFTQVKSVNVMI